MKRIQVGLFIGGMVLALGTPGWAGWLDGWDYRQEIVIDPSITPAQLNSFPLLISISDPAHPLFTQTNSPAGLDVVFTASDGTTVLPREIETYSASATPAINAWVSTQLRAASSTRLYMYYKGAEVAPWRHGSSRTRLTIGTESSPTRKARTMGSTSRSA